MKKIITLLMITSVLGQACMNRAMAEGVPATEYLKLTKENLPHVRVVMLASTTAAQIQKVSLATMKKRARRSAWLPRLRVRLDYDPNAIPDYEYKDDARRYQDGDYQDRWTRTGGTTDRFTYGGYLEWDMTQLIWEKEDHQLSEKYAQQAGLMRRRIVEVSKRYNALRQLLPDDSSGSIDPSDIAGVLDNALYLDAITDFILSDTLTRIRLESETK